MSLIGWITDGHGFSCSAPATYPAYARVYPVLLFPLGKRKIIKWKVIVRYKKSELLRELHDTKEAAMDAAEQQFVLLKLKGKI